ncbi:SecDF P1 head subdomain-containing protein [Kerstersia similis]|uniref:SecDF P1 head subdomain-containing protein n=1 Tax=Kerstersia similis TaxID=206505 RepID=UPI0039F0A542
MKVSTRLLFPWLTMAGAFTLAACQGTVPLQPETSPAAAAQQTQQAASTQAVEQSAVQAAPAIRFFLAQSRPADDLLQIQLDPQTSVYALPQPVFTQADMKQVVPLKSQQGQVFLRFDFNERGAEKLEAISQQAAGNYLVLTINDRVVAIPQVASAYEKPAVHVPMRSAEDAQAVVNLLRQGGQ